MATTLNLTKMANEVNKVCSVFHEVKNCILGWPEFRWKSSSQANTVDRAPAMEEPVFLNPIFFDGVTQTLYQKTVILKRFLFDGVDIWGDEFAVGMKNTVLILPDIADLKFSFRD
jgi:hypothetical protein